MNTARNCEMANIITAIDISDSNNYILEIPIERKTVEFGDDSDIVYKMNCVKAILEKEKNVQGVIIVKNAVTKSPYFREKV
jgi:hypothetical protein